MHMHMHTHMQHATCTRTCTRTRTCTCTCTRTCNMHMQHVPASHLVSELDRSIHFFRIPNPTIIPPPSPGAHRPRDARHVRRTGEDPSGRQAAPRYCQHLVRPLEGLERLQPSVVGCESQAPTTSCGCSRVSAPSCRGGQKKKYKGADVSFLGFRAELLRRAEKEIQAPVFLF